MSTSIRPRLNVGVHVSTDTGFVAPQVWTASDTSDIACVEIIDGLRVQSDEPDTLRLIADAFVQAAASIEDTR